MVRKTKNPSVWHNGMVFKWDPKVGDYVKWSSVGPNQRFCITYNEAVSRDKTAKAAAQIARLTPAQAAELVKRETRVRLARSLKLNFSWFGGSADDLPFDSFFDETPRILTSLADALDVRTLPKGFKAYVKRKDLVWYAKTVLKVKNPAPLYKFAPIDVINAINAELYRANALFGVRPHITELRVLASSNFEDWAEHYQLSGRTGFRIVDQYGADLNAQTWRRNMAVMYKNNQSSTPDWRHVIRHEIGHAYFSWLWKTNPIKAKRIFRNLTNYYLTGQRRFKTETVLSTLAVKNANELVAESFAVVLSGRRNNQIANEVVELILGKR